MTIATRRWVNGRIEAVAPGLVHPRRLVPEITANDMDYSDFAFGFSISGAVVTITAGEIHHGARAAIVVAETEKTITEDESYLWVAYTLGSGVGSVEGPSTTRPVSTDEIYRCWLVRLAFASGIATLSQIGHLGNIELPGVYA